MQVSSVRFRAWWHIELMCLLSGVWGRGCSPVGFLKCFTAASPSCSPCACWTWEERQGGRQETLGGSWSPGDASWVGHHSPPLWAWPCSYFNPVKSVPVQAVGCQPFQESGYEIRIALNAFLLMQFSRVQCQGLTQKGDLPQGFPARLCWGQVLSKPPGSLMLWLSASSCDRCEAAHDRQGFRTFRWKTVLTCSNSSAFTCRLFFQQCCDLGQQTHGNHVSCFLQIGIFSRCNIRTEFINL